jgi:hypothetical protein
MGISASCCSCMMLAWSELLRGVGGRLEVRRGLGGVTWQGVIWDSGPPSVTQTVQCQGPPVRSVLFKIDWLGNPDMVDRSAYG